MDLFNQIISQLFELLNNYYFISQLKHSIICIIGSNSGINIVVLKLSSIVYN